MGAQPAERSEAYLGFVVAFYALATLPGCRFLEAIGLPRWAGPDLFVSHYTGDDGRLDMGRLFRDIGLHEPMLTAVRMACRTPGPWRDRMISDTADVAAAALRAGDLDAADGLRALLEEMLAAEVPVLH